MTDNAVAAKSLFDAWERRDFDALAECLATGVSFTDAATGSVIEGRDNVRDFYVSWATASPDSVAGAMVVASSGGTVAVEGVWKGTNTGTFGPHPATGRPVSMPWSNILRFDDDGRVIAGTAYYDLLTPMSQMGHMKPLS